MQFLSALVLPLLPLLPLLSLPGLTHAGRADIYLYDSARCASTAGGYVCRNIADGSCCYKVNKLWKSVQVISPLGRPELIEPYTKQGNDYCAITLNNDPGPGCWDDSVMTRITGAFWFENPDVGGPPERKRGAMSARRPWGIERRSQDAATHVEVDTVFLIVDGVEYTLELGSKEGDEYEKLTDESAKEAYMKAHGKNAGPGKH